MRLYYQRQLCAPEGETPPAGPAVTPPAPPAAPPVADPPKPVVPVSVMPDDALKPRLEQAKHTGRTELLASLGLKDEAELTAVVAAHKQTLESQKTEQQKAAEREAALLTQTTRLTALEQAVKSTWDAEATKLTPEQLGAVTAIAGEDIALRVRTLNALRPTWATAAPAPTALAAAPAPASTAPTGGAPAPAGTQSPVDHKSHFEALQKVNPIAAARYMSEHAREIYPEP